MMIEQQQENEVELKVRKGYEDPEATYILPHDSAEHSRLDKKDRLIASIMRQKIIHASLQQGEVHQVVDLGCGTGVVTKALGAKFPDAQVFGMDLSPAPPQGEQFSANVSFLRGNVLTQEPMDWKPIRDGPSLTENEAMFELCYSRIFTSHLSEQQAVVNKQFRWLRPGGYIEMQERSGGPLGEDGLPVEGAEVFQEIADLWKTQTKGDTFTPGEKAAGWMRDAGFVDIQNYEYELPFKITSASPRVQEELSDIHDGDLEQDNFDATVGVIARLVQLGVLEEQRGKEMLGRVKNVLFSPGKAYARFIVTVGQKPLDSRGIPG